MAKPVWQQKLQAKLDSAPLVFVFATVPKGTPIKDIPDPQIKHIKCLAAGDKAGKKVTLRQITNYNCFNTCVTCGVTVR